MLYMVTNDLLRFSNLAFNICKIMIFCFFKLLFVFYMVNAAKRFRDNMTGSFRVILERVSNLHLLLWKIEVFKYDMPFAVLACVLA